jgi:hypothetical protein
MIGATMLCEYLDLSLTELHYTQLCDFELLGELASSVADPVDVDRDVPWSAEYLVVPVRRRINQEPRVLYPTNELADRDLSLQPR